MDYELPYSILGKVVDRLSVSKDVDKTAMQQLENVEKALEAQFVRQVARAIQE